MTTYQRLGDYIREVNVRNRDFAALIALLTSVM